MHDQEVSRSNLGARSFLKSDFKYFLKKVRIKETYIQRLHKKIVQLEEIYKPIWDDKNIFMLAFKIGIIFLFDHFVAYHWTKFQFCA